MKTSHWALRVVLCILVIIACFLLESSLSIRVSVFGAHIDLLPALVASAAVCLGSPAGMICGAAAGMMYDIGGASVEGLYPLYYMCCGIVAGYIGEQRRAHQLKTVAMLSAAMSVLLSLVRYLFYLQFTTDAGILLVMKAIIAAMVLAVVVSPLSYWMIRTVSGGPQRLKKKERSRRRKNDLKETEQDG